MELAGSLQLTPDQIHSFIHEGYLHLPQLLPSHILEELQQATDRLSGQAKDLPQAAIIRTDTNEDFVIGIEHICALNEPIFRKLLGSPLLLSIARAICGADFFPVQDFIVIKSLGDGNEVNWHQDLLTKSLGKAIMIGFYLDPANDRNGALRVIPRSHQSDRPICELEKMDYTSTNMEAGDIFIHDLMLAHSSGKLTDQTQRRVVYFEFMSTGQAISEAVYPETFVTTRKELLSLARSVFSDTGSGETIIEAASSVNRIREICLLQRKTHIANYCFDPLGM